MFSSYFAQFLPKTKQTGSCPTNIFSAEGHQLAPIGDLDHCGQMGNWEIGLHTRRLASVWDLIGFSVRIIYFRRLENYYKTMHIIHQRGFAPWT